MPVCSVVSCFIGGKWSGLLKYYFLDRFYVEMDI